jgi:biopolymer transport protein TolR
VLIERRSGRRLMNQINVVPYIDVMLVLLVIFMITAPFINPGQVELPSIGEASDPPVQPMEVTIEVGGTLTLHDRARSGGPRRVSRDDLIAAIQEKQRQHPEQAVVIAADKDVVYAQVVEVMDMLRRHEVRRVGLLVKPAEK